MQFRCADEFRITSAVWSFRESLNGYAKQALAQEHDQHLKLVVAQILIGKLHLPSPIWWVMSHGYCDVCGMSPACRLNHNLNVLIQRHKRLH
ncbi:hypothetical protein D3C85_1658760 [compost metagenome]